MGESAVICEEVWKSFRIYHQRSNSLKERVITRRNHFEEFWALRDISLEIPHGATLGIVGSNGSGKSTLLKTIARILTPNKGSVRVEGRMSSLLELGTGFHPELTGRENVFLGGSVMGMSKLELNKNYTGIVEFAGIESFIDMPMKNYSSGMYARLAFALAISVDPEILVIDEVLAVGDEDFQSRCHQRIAEFRRDGRTIVLVSHGLENIRALCQDAIWIDKGNLRSYGKSNDVVSEYLAEVYRGDDSSEHSASKKGRFGTGEVKIDEVVVLDRDGVEMNAFTTGEPVTIRVRYNARERLVEGNCVLQVFRSSDMIHVYGHSSEECDLRPILDGSGTIDVTIPKLPLLKGAFVMTVALQHADTGHVWDCLDRSIPLMVFDAPTGRPPHGVVDLETTWRAY
jgi:ABC-type polysaccharide/polyol phosphate transport system ATPase subunit